jgi:hypothetical protein
MARSLRRATTIHLKAMVARKVTMKVAMSSKGTQMFSRGENGVLGLHNYVCGLSWCFMGVRSRFEILDLMENSQLYCFLLQFNVTFA